MKHTFISATALALFVGSIIAVPAASRAQQTDVDTSNAPSCAVLSTNLRYGARDVGNSSDVSILQDFLNTKGYLASQPTGFFGHGTLTAVESFQSAYGITPSGFVGPITRAKIQAVDCSPSTVPPVTPITYPTPVTYPTYIPGPSSVTDQPDAVTQPEHGATYMVGQTVSIGWNIKNAAQVSISLVDKSGMSVLQIASNVPNTGSYKWVATDGLFTGNYGTYRVSVSAVQTTGGLTTSLQSDFFSIVAINPQNPLVFQSINWNNFGDMTPDFYENPRVNFGGQDMITYNDDVTATQWCKMVPGKSYVRGESHTNWANPQDGMHNKYDGAKWVQLSSGDYPRYYTCFTN